MTLGSSLNSSIHQSSGYLKLNVPSGEEYVLQLEVGSVTVGFCVGQGANSQFGSVRPTADPSGHIFASIVQATFPISSFTGKMEVNIRRGKVKIIKVGVKMSAPMEIFFNTFL